MKLKKIIALIIIIIIGLIPNIVLGAEINNLNISSVSAILIEANTGKILYEKEANSKKYPASTTKVMTAILTLENVENLESIATVSYNAVFTVPVGYSTDLLKVGEEISVEELLYAMLIKSSNEAANVLAEYVGGSVESFATMMNTKANELGCKNTNFVNPNGVHNENHYSTAYDLSLIGKYAMKNATFRKIVSTVSHTLPATNKYDRTDRNLITTNDLINKNNKNYYEYAIGVKTGYTSQAKNCLIAAANKDGIETIAVTLGAEKNLSNGLSARDQDCKKLFNYVYDNYSEKVLTEKGKTIIKTIEVSNSTKENKQLDLIAENDIKVLVTNDKENEKIEPEIIVNDNIKAPIVQGDILGKAIYKIDGQEYTTNLVASKNVEKSDFIILILKIILIIIILIIFAEIIGKLSRKKKRKKKTKGKYMYK